MPFLLQDQARSGSLGSKVPPHPTLLPSQRTCHPPPLPPPPPPLPWTPISFLTNFLLSFSSESPGLTPSVFQWEMGALFEVSPSFIVQISDPGPHFLPEASPRGRHEAPAPQAAVPAALHPAAGEGHERSQTILVCPRPVTLHSLFLSLTWRQLQRPFLWGPSAPRPVLRPRLHGRLGTASARWPPGWLPEHKPLLGLIRCVRLGEGASSWALSCANWGEDCTFVVGRPCRHAGWCMGPAGAAPAAVSAPSTRCHSRTFWNTHIVFKALLVLALAGPSFMNKRYFWAQHLPLALAWLNVDGTLCTDPRGLHRLQETRAQTCDGTGRGLNFS